MIGLYALGLAVITLGGVVGPLVAAATREDLDASQRETAATAAERDAARAERDDARSDRDEARSAREAADADRDAAEREADDAREESLDLQATLDALQTSQARFELYEDRGGEWRWRLRHRNGNVIADSAEGYTRKHDAQRGMQSVRRNALGATTLLFEQEAELPEADEAFEPVEERASRATFEVEEDSAGKYRWRLRHDNGELIGDSGQGYASERGARRSIERIREYAGPVDYLWFDPTGFEVYRDAAGEYRWRLVHRNGNVIADSGESYTRSNDARRAARRLRDRVDDLEFEVYEDAGGEFRWRLRGANDELVADSGEGYASRSGAEDAVERVQRHAPDAAVLDVEPASFEIYQDRGGEHRWRLRHRNGNVLMDGGEGYSSRSTARDGIESVKRNAANAEIAD